MTKEKPTIGDWILRGAVWMVAGVVSAMLFKIVGYLLFLAIMSAAMLWDFLSEKKPDQEVFCSDV